MAVIRLSDAIVSDTAVIGLHPVCRDRMAGWLTGACVGVVLRLLVPKHLQEAVTEAVGDDGSGQLYLEDASHPQLTATQLLSVLLAARLVGYLTQKSLPDATSDASPGAPDGSKQHFPSKLSLKADDTGIRRFQRKKCLRPPLRLLSVCAAGMHFGRPRGREKPLGGESANHQKGHEPGVSTGKQQAP